MHKSIMTKRSSYAAVLLSASLAVATSAWANPQIQAQAVALKVIPAPTTVTQCLACHTTGQANADIPNLKPGYQAAYKLNKTTLANLKALLNVLPTTTVGLAGSGLAKTDVYEVTCVTGAASLSASVIDLAPVKLATVSTQVTKGTIASAVSTDTKDGDTLYSVPTKLVGGVGPYLVKVNKSAYTGTVATEKGAETYAGKLSCLTAANVPTGLAWRIVQNQ